MLRLAGAKDQLAALKRSSFDSVHVANLMANLAAVKLQDHLRPDYILKLASNEVIFTPEIFFVFFLRCFAIKIIFNWSF